MSSRAHKKRMYRVGVLRDSLLLARQYLTQKEAELARQLAGKTMIYLDTNHWINLRHVLLCHPQAKPEYVQIMSVLENLSTAERVCCPVSATLFEELMKQTDPGTRFATARLMDQFSQRVCIQYYLLLARKEWRHNVWRVMGFTDSARTFPIWTMAGFWAGQEDSLTDLKYWEGKPFEEIKAWVEQFWSVGFEQAVNRPALQRSPYLGDFISKLNDPQERAKDQATTFPELLRAEKFAALKSLKEEFFKEPLPVNQIPPTEIFSSFVDANNPSLLPSVQVAASILAAWRRSNKPVQPNDFLDFMHAASAVPYCDAFFCDNAMASFFTSPPLNFDKVYGVKILSRPPEMLHFLQHL